MRTLLSKWYIVQLNKLMYSDPMAAVYRKLLSEHEVNRILCRRHKSYEDRRLNT